MIYGKQNKSKEKMNYILSSSPVLELGLDGFFPLLLVLFLDYFLVEVHQLGWSGSWHSPSIGRISSFIDWLSVCLLIEIDSFCVSCCLGLVFGLFLILFVHGAHSVNPINSVFLFSLGHSVSFSGIVAFNFLDLFTGV